ncbi:cell wall-binding repeat-containing protein, partial [Clostridioides sp. ES-S-0049-02]|uniref:cell wall-binding repeat-containing protein n=1 Tax=Clostridioides sp. ES-S-0049-02 TaxID=2770778 RepID=UPI001D124F73
MKIPKKIAAMLTVTMIAGSSTAGIASAQTVATNLTGQERYETAVKISQDGWKNADEVVIVNDSSIADALSATPFAKAKNAPILLTGKDKLNDKTKAELQRLKAKKVYLIGGTSVLSANIEKQIKDLKISFERISGAERYQTSLELAKRLDAVSDVKKIAVVNGEKGLADAVSVGAPAAQNNMPVILADSKNGTAVADKFIKDAGITQSYVIGGESSVSEAVKNKLPNSTRLGGTDRNDTNAKVVKEFYKKTDLKNAYVTKDGMAKQDQLIDALAVGVLGAKNQSPVVLVGKNLSASQKTLVNSKSFDKITKVGGNGNETAFNEIKSLQEVSTSEAKTIAELKSAVDKATANDVINFKPTSEVKEAFTIQTDKAVTVNLNGTYTKAVTINMPNGDVNNYAKVDDVVIDDVKDGTFVNYGKITNLKVNDKNGAKIENNSKGEIGSLTVASGASQVKVTNGGKITTVTNNSKGTTIDNKGTISTVKGDNSPSISGNNPGSNSSGGSSSSGGGSHGGSSSGGSSSNQNQTAVNKEAAKITSVTAPAKDATKLTMPSVSSGYTIAIKSSSSENVIKKDGTIVPQNTATTVKLVFTVTHTSSGKTADTKEIEVVVPAKSTDEELQAAVNKEAAKITSVTAPAKDATKLTMPSVSTGYTIAIKTSDKEAVIDTNGTIVPPDADETVKLVFTVTQTSSGKTADTKEIDVLVPAKSTEVIIGSGSVAGATAGDKEITGLTSGKIYKVTMDGNVKYTKADGTLGEEADKAAITGTSITGLENGKTYKVEEYVAPAATEVIIGSGSVAGATAGDKKITGLTTGKIYKVTVDGNEKYTKADGTLGEEADKAAITGTEITGLENGKTYKVEEYVAPAATEVIIESGSVAGATAGDKKITGLTTGKIYKVTVDGNEKYTKADGTLGEEADKAAITGTEITGLENGKTYKVEEYVAPAATEVIIESGSVAGATAGDKKITGLT